MMIKRTTLGWVTIPFITLSWLKWSLIEASMISFATTCAVMLTTLSSPESFFNLDIVEYWVAGISWLLVGAWLTWNLIRKRKVAEAGKRNRRSVAFLCTLTVVALVSPILVPVPPNVQGNLITTRLLPPLSQGFVAEPFQSDQNLRTLHWLQHQRQNANAFLLRTPDVHGATPPAELLSAGDHEVSRFVFLFGTDDFGRDVFSRVISGTRVSFAIGGFSSLGSLLIGVLVGFGSGYGNRFVDSVLMRMTDVFLAIPSLFLVIGIAAFLGQSLVTLIIILALTGWMGIARTVRIEVIKLREKEFVFAARMLNQSSWTILRRHIFPNLKPIVVTAVVLQLGNAILAEASLSFLGLGIQPPTASWGNMLGQSLGYLRTGWWLGIFPGILLASVLIAAHYAIDGKENTA